MNNKERVLKACKELVGKYRNPVGKKFFHRDSCPLCEIFINKNRHCMGCPLAPEIKRYGCVDFKSYQNAYASIGKRAIVDGANYTPEVKAAFNARAKFFERIKPILEAMPPERFTEKGWKYTGDIIPREW